MLGGTFTTKHMMSYFCGKLVDDPYSDLQSNERAIALPDRGIGPLNETYEAVRETIRSIKAETGKRILVGGISQGGRIAVQLGLEREVDGVISYAGPQGGLKFDDKRLQFRTSLKMAGLVAKYTSEYSDFSKLPVARDLAYGSDSMLAHEQALATDWPADIPLWVIGASRDLIVAPESVFGFCPQAKERVVLPGVAVPRLGQVALRHGSDVPHTIEPLIGSFTTHLSLTRSSAAVRLMNSVQSDMSVS